MRSGVFYSSSISTEIQFCRGHLLDAYSAPDTLVLYSTFYLHFAAEERAVPVIKGLDLLNSLGSSRVNSAQVALPHCLLPGETCRLLQTPEAAKEQVGRKSSSGDTPDIQGSLFPFSIMFYLQELCSSICKTKFSQHSDLDFIADCGALPAVQCIGSLHLLRVPQLLQAPHHVFHNEETRN